MTKQTEALKLALEALENLEEHLPFDWAFDELQSLAGKDEYRKDLAKARSLIPVIYEALAQPEQEPVFWYKPYPNGMYNGPIHNAQIGDVLRGSEEWTPLYATPPQRTWVGLTHEKRVSIIREDENRSLLEHCERIEQVLKEDNGA